MQSRTLVRHVFRGCRFDDHTLDVDVLDELVTYKKVLVETAKELWRRRNPGRSQLPAHFEERYRLRVGDIEEGSTSVRILRNEFDHADDRLLQPADELDDALELVTEAIGALQRGESLPAEFPQPALRALKQYGKTLRADESFAYIVNGEVQDAVFTPAIRERLGELMAVEESQPGTLEGEVRAADIDAHGFTLRLRDGRSVRGRFPPDAEATVTDALRRHESVRLWIRGTMVRRDGELHRIASIEEWEARGVVAKEAVSPVRDLQCNASRAIELLDEWDDPGVPDEDEQRQTLEYLQEALDEDRPGYRRLFAR